MGLLLTRASTLVSIKENDRTQMDLENWRLLVTRQSRVGLPWSWECETGSSEHV